MDILIETQKAIAEKRGDYSLVEVLENSYSDKLAAAANAWIGLYLPVSLRAPLESSPEVSELS